MDPLAVNAAHYAGPTGILLLDHDEALGEYLPDTLTAGPRKSSLAVLAPRSFDRVIAQSGVFTVSHASDMRPLNTVVPAAFDSWTIPLPHKEQIRNELDTFNINASTVYPDLSHICDRISSTFRR